MGDNQPRSNLQKLTFSDLEMVRNWRNNPEVRKYMYTQHEISSDEHVAWYSKVSNDPLKTILIYRDNNKRAVGCVNLTFSESTKHCNWGFYLSPNAQKGDGAKMGFKVIQYVFEMTDTVKLRGEVLEFNERSIRYHLRLGFRQEGGSVKRRFDEKKSHDVIHFGMNSRDYIAAKSGNN